MTTDISVIKEELKGFEEVDSPFEIQSDRFIKYITLDDGIQQFYKGGKYLRMGDNKVFFSDNGRVKSFKIKEGFIFLDHGKILKTLKVTVEL